MCSYCSVVHLVLSSEDVGLSEGTLRLEPTELARHGTGPGIQRLVFFPRFLLDLRGSVDHVVTAASCHARGRDMCQAQCCPFSLVTEICPPTSPPPPPRGPTEIPLTRTLTRNFSANTFLTHRLVCSLESIGAVFLFFLFYTIYSFIWLCWVLVVAHGILRCGAQAPC